MTVELKNRAKQLLADYQDGASVADLARMYGISGRWVYELLRLEGVSPDRRRQKTPISPLHKAIGSRLIEHMYQQGLDKRHVANNLEWTFQKLSRVMQGVFDLTILDLQELAALLRVDYTTLMTVPKQGS
jgi:hypothetical protein